MDGRLSSVKKERVHKWAYLAENQDRIRIRIIDSYSLKILDPEPFRIWKIMDFNLDVIAV